MIEPSRHLDADRALALYYVPAIRRLGVAALWELDATLGGIVASGTQPAISQIKLVWWRDSLEALQGGRVPAEPLLQRLHAHVVAAGVPAEALAGMSAGWERLLEPEALQADDLSRYARERGGVLFTLSARLLGAAGTSAMARAGAGWALVDFARRSSRREEREAALSAARAGLAAGPAQWPAPLRPLGMLARLAARDVRRGAARMETPGSPARMLGMLHHRLTGR